MTAEPITLPAFPSPMRWLGEPEAWKVEGDDRLTITAGARTDLFNDPGGPDRLAGAPALLGRIEGDYTLSADVSFDARATFDAGVLLLYAGAGSWAKLCLEVSPQGNLMIVSVVTRGVSDDCNSVTVDSPPARLRVSRIGSAFAFHAAFDTSGDTAGDTAGGSSGADGFWHLIRYFALDGDPEVGFLAQSPTGQGCSVAFSRIRHAPTRPGDLRDGQ